MTGRRDGADRADAAPEGAPGRAGGTDPEAEAELERVRARISEVDDRLIRALGERHDLVLEVARLKARLGLPVLDPRREAQVVRNAAARARALGVDEEMTRDVIWRIIASARAIQEGRPAGWPDPPAIPEPRPATPPGGANPPGEP